MKDIDHFYHKLLKLHGPQGWWPLRAKKADIVGTYHKGDYCYPKSDRERFEICVGAILTQNSSWGNVEQALYRMDQNDLLDPVQILQVDDDTLQDAIRPAGYYNQKAKKLRIFSTFYQGLAGRNPDRAELLGLWGIGPETADSILLYAFGILTFVVDTYTKRIFESLGILTSSETYEEIRSLFENSLPDSLEVYQEYHALVVVHAKEFFSKKMGGTKSPLLR